jgi:Pectate lyase superfamily protein
MDPTQKGVYALGPVAQEREIIAVSMGGTMPGRVWRISHLRSSRLFGTSVLISAVLLFSLQLALGQITQQGSKLVGTGAIGNAQRGTSVALSGDGSNTPTGSIIPSVRNFAWNPGMMSQGGIPNRTTICATLSPKGNGADDSVQINNAIKACSAGQVVYLNAGNFTVNNYILVNKAITLRGAGAGISILTKTNGARARSSTVMSGTNGILTPVGPSSYNYDMQPIIIVGPARWPRSDSTTSQNLTADGAQGSYSVTVPNGRVFTVGQFVLLDELSGASWQPVPTGFGCTRSVPSTPCPPQVWAGDHLVWNMHYPVQRYQDDNGAADASGPYDTTPGMFPRAMGWFCRTDPNGDGRCTNEIKQVAAVSGNTITFTSPLAISYRVSHSAQLTQYTANSNGGNGGVQVANAGIENLTAVGGADGAVRFEVTAYCWAKNIEVTQWIGEGVAIDNSFRVELRDSYIHTASWPEPGGTGYAISLASASSEILIENNISIDVNKVIIARSSGSGSVVAYNYMDDGWIYTSPTWQEIGVNASHMAGSHHVLFEGNYSFNGDSDYTHGNAIYMTYFRNWFTGQRRDFTTDANKRAAGLSSWAWWDSFVGNILGNAGASTRNGWLLTAHSMACNSTGNNCTGGVADWNPGSGDIWELGVDQERWTQVPESQTLATVIRDGNWDFLTGTQHWYNTPGGFTMPNSLYLTSAPAFFGSNPWPWTNPATGAIYTLPAKTRYDAGTPNTVPY